jgi:short-subunit dehydrogenase
LNLSSLILSNRAAVRQFLQQGTGGSILNMGSVLGSRPSPQFFATHVYAATKAAALASQIVRRLLCANDIRFNVLAPALVETPMAQRAANDETILSSYAPSNRSMEAHRSSE